MYAKREQYESSPNVVNMNFLQFARTFKVVNNELAKLPENVIPRIFPIYSSNPRWYVKTHGIELAKYNAFLEYFSGRD